MCASFFGSSCTFVYPITSSNVNHKPRRRSTVSPCIECRQCVEGYLSPELQQSGFGLDKRFTLPPNSSSRRPYIISTCSYFGNLILQVGSTDCVCYCRRTLPGPSPSFLGGLGWCPCPCCCASGAVLVRFVRGAKLRALNGFFPQLLRTNRQLLSVWTQHKPVNSGPCLGWDSPCLPLTTGVDFPVMQAYADWM